MQKPSGIDWNNVKPSDGSSRRIVPGGYVCRIRLAEDVPDKEYLRIDLDIDEGEFKNYFADMYVRFGRKWPCTRIASYKSTAIGMFKGFITSVEESNDRYVWDWDEAKLKGKSVGVLFGEEEYIGQDGEVHTVVKPQIFCSVETIHSGNFKIPKIKKLDSDKSTTYIGPESNIHQTGSMNGIPSFEQMESIDPDEIPF